MKTTVDKVVKIATDENELRNIIVEDPAGRAGGLDEQDCLHNITGFETQHLGFNVYPWKGNKYSIRQMFTKLFVPYLTSGTPPSLFFSRF